MNAVARLPNGLTPLQDAFVDAYIANGGNATNAAKTAGYAAESAEQRGYEALQKPHVLAVLRERTERYISSRAPRLLQVIENIAFDNNASAQVRLAAAKDLLDRSGYKAVDKIDVQNNTTQAERESKLLKLMEIMAANNSLPPALLDRLQGIKPIAGERLDSQVNKSQEDQ